MKEEMHDLLDIKIVVDNGNISIGVLQHPVMTSIAEDSEVDDLVDMTTEILASTVSTILQTVPDSNQNVFLEKLRDVIENRCVNEIVDRVVNSEREFIEEN